MVKICALPCSGQGFVSQLALMSIIPKTDIPKIFFSCSGGCISSYIALAADYDICGMERVLRMINSSMFLRSWWPSPMSFLPSYLAGYSRGSWYDRGSGFEPMFQTLFTPDLIGRKEIWTATTCCSNSKNQLFCNLDESKVKLGVNNFTLNEFNTLPLRYLNRNISDISAITLASASIPSFVPPVIFYGENYCDGGATYASPLTPMSPILRSYNKLHITYVNSFDVINSAPLCLQNMGTLIKTTTTEMIHSMILQDRSIGLEIVRKGSNKLNYFEFCCSEEILNDLYSFRKRINRSLLELYPIKYYTIELDNYNFEEAKKILYLDRKQFKCRFWWTGNKELVDYEIGEHLKEIYDSATSM